jgi:hypothetical protein
MHVIDMHTLRRFRWSYDFNSQKCSSMVKQCHKFNLYREGVFTPNITSFTREISSFFKIHQTSPSLKYQEGSTSPLLYFLCQCLFLVFKEIIYLLTPNLSLFSMIYVSIKKMEYFLIYVRDIVSEKS